MPRLSIALLGSFQVILDGSPVTGFRSDKARALLAYLAVNSQQPHRREALATLLWPDCSEEVARNNLRQTLFALRQALSDREATSPFLRVTQQDLQFDATSDHSLDVTAFETLLVPCPWHRDRPSEVCQFCEERLKDAANLYRGNFLAGLSLPDSLSFDEWARFKQEEFHRQAIDVLGRLAAWHERRREYSQAAAYASRELILEPWHEEAHRCLMRTLMLSGQRSLALHQYEICRDSLADALGAEPEDETRALYGAILAQTLAVPSVPRQNPYRGLQFFTQADAAYFYGRETFVSRLVSAVQECPLVAVIGPSGSGKSSVIYAGLLPALSMSSLGQTGSGAPNWLVAAFRPGAQPFESLAAALMPLIPGDARSTSRGGSAGRLAAALESGTATLSLVAGDILSGSQPGSRLLLVADQLEEIYTLCSDPATRNRFLDVLLATRGAEGSSEGAALSLVVSLRADFMGQALAYLPFAEALGGGGLMLGPMSRQETARAIEEPARAQGVVFEPGLVARLLGDARDEPGILPLLEFALTLLWEGRPNGVLTHATYDDLGGVLGALAHQAEQFYAALSTEDQDQARRVLLQLVRPGQQTDDTRRVATRAELGPDGWNMAQRLADVRLVVTGQEPVGQETVEIAHEALITRWERLRQWLEEDRAFRVWQDRTRVSAAAWEASERDEEALLRGAPLAEAERWLVARARDLSDSVRSFVTAGIERRERKAKAAEVQRQRELVEARGRAEREARSSKRLRLLVAGLATLFVILAIAAALAVSESQESQRSADAAMSAQATAQAAVGQIDVARKNAEAERERAEGQARLALGRQLAAQAHQLLEKQPDLGLLLGVEASRLSGKEDASNLLLSLRLSPYLAAILHGPSRPVYGLAFAAGKPDTLVTAAADGNLQSWDISTGKPIGQPVGENLPPGTGVAVSPDGLVAATSQGHEITVWDVAGARPLRPVLQGHQADVRVMAFTDDGKTLVSGDKAGNILRWDVSSGMSTRVPFTDTGRAVWALSGDGRRLAMTVEAIDPGFAAVRVMDLATGQPVGPPLIGHKETDGIHGLSLSPDGRTLASTSYDKTSILWDVETGKPLHPPLTGHSARALVSAFSPDGRTLATGAEDDRVLLWDVATGQQIDGPLEGHGNWVLSLAFSHDGRRLASASSDGKTIIWDLSKSRPFPDHTAQIRGLAFSPDGRRLASGGYEGTTILYDVATGKPLAQSPRVDEHAILNVAFSPTGKRVAVASAGGEAVLRDPATLQQIGPLLGEHTAALVGLAFSPDGHILATGGFDKNLNLWNADTGQRLRGPLPGHTNWILSLAFSPDGKLLASGGADDTIILWDVATGKRIGEPLTGHTNWVTGLTFSPDGKTLVSGSADNTIRFWDVGTRAALGPALTGHVAPVWNVMFDPRDGGRTLVSGSSDGTVIRWDVATRQPLAPPLAGNAEGETMALSPDGQTIAMGDPNGRTIVWQMPSTSWTEQACRVANRNLTPAEWKQYLHDEPYRRTCPDLP